MAKPKKAPIPLLWVPAHEVRNVDGRIVSKMERPVWMLPHYIHSDWGSDDTVVEGTPLYHASSDYCEARLGPDAHIKDPMFAEPSKVRWVTGDMRWEGELTVRSAHRGRSSACYCVDVRSSADEVLRGFISYGQMLPLFPLFVGGRAPVKVACRKLGHNYLLDLCP